MIKDAHFRKNVCNTSSKLVHTGPYLRVLQKLACASRRHTSWLVVASAKKKLTNSEWINIFIMKWHIRVVCMTNNPNIAGQTTLLFDLRVLGYEKDR